MAAPARLTLTATVLLLSACATHTAEQKPALQAVARTDANSMRAHEQLLQKARSGRIDLYFLGDSITRRWGATDYPQLLEHWNASFHGWNAGNFGWGGDKVENIVWRIENGELGVKPRVIVLMAGTNDVGNQVPAQGIDTAAAEISSRIGALLAAVRVRAPEATVILMGILPRADNPAVMPVINRINQRIAQLADGRRVRYLNINAGFMAADGSLLPGMMTGDQLHLALPGYRAWAAALNPLLIQLLGPREAEDHAPAPTGDPSAQR
jgi:lysophospholipase L1-like esterase